MNNDKVLNEIYLSKKSYKLIAYFWLGFLLYTVSFVFYATDTIDRVICVMLQLIGLIILSLAAFKLIKFRIENNYLKYIYVLYFEWLLIIIYRGVNFDFLFLKQMFFNPFNGIFLYLVPLILLFPSNLGYYKLLFKAIFILGLFYISFGFLFANFIVYDLDGKGLSLVEYFSKSLSISSGFVLLTYIYHPKKQNFVALIVMLMTLIFAIIRARRGLIFMSCSILAVYFLIYSYVQRKNIYLFFLLFTLLLLCITIINLHDINKSAFIFGSIRERLYEDTRTEVEDFFYADMKQRDWIIGKGLNGMYYAPTDEVENPNAPYRDGIETDYLTIILKGGVIHLGLLVLIAVPAIFKGLFYSRNILSKASALWVILWLHYLYPTTVTTFTMSYILVWISISICYSKAIRRMTDSQIKNILILKYRFYK